jgi:transcriptional regulator with XRE-family HTH domain
MEVIGTQVNGLHVCGSRRQAFKPSAGPRRHRISEVLEEEGLSLRTAAMRMGITTAQARSEADPAVDLSLSALCRWQAALNVPIADLLTAPGMSLSPAVQLRARLLKAMRTVRSLQLQVDDEAAQSLAITLAQQLLDMMPELKVISGWPTVGVRRTLDELGAIVDRNLPDDFFEVAAK